MFECISVLESQNLIRSKVKVGASSVVRHGCAGVPANVARVGVCDTLIDVLGLGDPTIKAVSAIATRTRNPKVLAGDLIEIVRLEAKTGQTLERAVAVIERRAGLRELHESDATWSREPRRFVLDVHNARAHSPAPEANLLRPVYHRRQPPSNTCRGQGTWRFVAILHALSVLAFDDATGDAYRRIVEALGYSRRKLLDRMIAAQAIVHRATPVTQNASDFQDFPGLDPEVW